MRGSLQEELADVQIKEEEKQRVFGVIPNFYVSHQAEIPPLLRQNTSLGFARGNRRATRSRFSGLEFWRGLTRPEIAGAHTDRERKDTQSAMVQVMRMFLQQHLSEAR